MDNRYEQTPQKIACGADLCHLRPVENRRKTANFANQWIFVCSHSGISPKTPGKKRFFESLPLSRYEKIHSSTELIYDFPHQNFYSTMYLLKYLRTYRQFSKPFSILSWFDKFWDLFQNISGISCLPPVFNRSETSAAGDFLRYLFSVSTQRGGRHGYSLMSSSWRPWWSCRWRF